MLEGNTIFAGDSITVGLARFVQVNGDKKTVAEGGRTSDWLFQQVRNLADTGALAGYQNMVVLIGTNDIGGGRSPESLSTAIQGIWATARSRGLRVFAMTVPPVKGYAGFASTFPTVNARRKALNASLGEAFVRGQCDGLIDLSSLLADQSDPDKLAQAFDGGDHLHPRKDALGALLTRALSGGATSPLGVPPLASAELSPLPSEDLGSLLLLVGVGGILAYLLTRKRFGGLRWPTLHR